MTPERFRRIDRVVSLALECEQTKRAAFLEAECGGDAELRREVEMLLNAHTQAGGFLENAPASLAAELISQHAEGSIEGLTSSAPLRTGAAMGRFTILDQLGGGGMGLVYQAYDPELDRKVAIKLMRPLATEKVPASDSRARVVREAQAMARLSHPNVIAVHEVGTFGDQVFIAMEYVEGETLTQWLSEQKRSWRDVLEIFAQAGRGLAAAHSAGILHRDFKPDNVLVGRDGRARVLDFGLARPLVHTALTEPARLFGTPGYMSPEQLMRRPADARSDEFSFCVAFYQALYGELPFGGETVEALLDEMRRGTLEDQRKGKGVPAWLRQVVLRGLEFDPAERYASMDALLDDLSRPTTSSRRAAVIASAVIGLVAILLIGREVLKQPGAGPARIQSLAVLPFQNLTGDPSQESFVDRVTEALTTDLAHVSNVSVIAPASAMPYKKTARPLLEVAAELGVDAVIRGSVSHRGAGVRVEAQLVQPATGQVLFTKKYESGSPRMIMLQADLARDVITQIESNVTIQQQAQLAALRSVKPEVYEAHVKARHFLANKNAASLQRAIEYFEQVLREDPRFAPAYAGLAEAYIGLSSPATVLSPKESARLATAAAMKALSLDPALGEPHAVLGWIKQNIDWDWPGAGKELKQAITLNPNHAQGHRWYGDYLVRVGRLEEALIEFKRAQRLDPLSVNMQQGIAQWFEAAGQHEEAIREFKKAIELDPTHGPAHAHLSAVYHGQHRHQEALAEVQKAYELSGSPWHRVGMAHELAHLGRTAEAEAILEEMKDRVTDNNAALSIARAFAVLGRKEETLQWIQRAYEARAFGLAVVVTQPDFDFLRTDPRFQEIVRRIGAPRQGE